jgi:hypothetical protein
MDYLNLPSTYPKATSVLIILLVLICVYMLFYYRGFAGMKPLGNTRNGDIDHLVKVINGDDSDEHSSDNDE